MPQLENPEHRRSWTLEIVGLIAIVGFFIGIGWAWHTQISNLITQAEFDQLQTGQSVSEANQIFGLRGQQRSSAFAASSEVEYRWENSSDSMAIGIFVDGKLIEKSAKNLP